SWRGGNNKFVPHGVVQIAHDYAVAGRDLLLGGADAAGPSATVLRVLVAVSFVVAATLTLRGARAGAVSTGRVDSGARMAAALLAAVVAGYIACMAYAAS